MNHRALPSSQALGFVAVANGGSGDLVLLDATDYHVVARVALGSDADNVRYDASAKQLFVGYGSGAIARVALDGKRIGEVKLAGHPESFQLEPSGSRIFVNVPDARQVAVLDRTSMSMIGTWPVTRGGRELSDGPRRHAPPPVSRLPTTGCGVDLRHEHREAGRLTRYGRRYR